jgi:hypothetical protein
MRGRFVRNLSELRSRILGWGGAVASLVWGVSRAVQNSWTCDDAWISIRYARNLVEGLGLVFNAGERVEGYTNFLWVLWTAPAFSFGIEPENWADAWGILFFAGTVAILAVPWCRSGDPIHRALPLPVAGILLALNPDSQVWATGGLETAAFAFFLAAGFVELADAEVAPLRSLLAGFLFALACLMRPDGLLPAAVAAAWVFVFAARKVAAVSAFGFGLVVPVGVFFVWRHAYYGDWLPNTYYAKSAWLAWWDQGWTYAGLFFERNGLLLAGFPLLIAWLLARRRRPLGANAECGRLFREALLAAGIVASYTLYVVRVGGDFMYARFLIPAVPFFALLFERSLALLLPGRRAWAWGLSAIVAGAPYMVGEPVQGSVWIHGIANERAYYSPLRTEHADEAGLQLRQYFDGLPVRIVVFGAEVRLAYRSEASVVIDAHGLTDRHVAHMPLLQRGRVGHERLADLPYLVSDRAVHFMFHQNYYRLLHVEDYVPRWPIRFGGVEGFVLSWDPPIMREVVRRGAETADFPSMLDRYIGAMPSLPAATVMADYARFRRFYFDHVPDPVREGRFRDRLGRP